MKLARSLFRCVYRNVTSLILILFQHAFENLEPDAKDGIVDEILNQGAAVFSEVAKNQWGSYCIQHSMSAVKSLWIEGPLTLFQSSNMVLNNIVA